MRSEGAHPARRLRDRIRDHLTADEIRAHGPAIAAAIAARAAAWGGVGWAYVGRSPAIGIELRIAPASRPPRGLAHLLPLPRSLGGHLRVRASRAGEHLPPPYRPLSFLALEKVVAPLAPGARILVGRGDAQSSAGVAAVVSLDGRLHLLTCGHVFGADPEVYTDPEASPIATLSRSYLEGPDPLDAAVCELGDAGRDLLDRSADAVTWFSGCRAPGPEDNGATAVFYPTSCADGEPFEANVSSYWASTSVLFRHGRQDGLLELSFCAEPGDSGSVLAIEDDYIGLCSGQIEARWTFFTPIAAVLARLEDDYAEVSLWHPRSGAVHSRS